MLTAVPLAVWGAIALAGASSFFGVALARMVWADDLRMAERNLASAKEIDRIRSETEGHLRRTIATLEETIAIYKRGSTIK